MLEQVLLYDIEAVIASSPAVSYTNQVVAAMAVRGAPVVICGANFTLAAFLLLVRGTGYTVLCAAAARSLVAAGLHPSLSLHHKSNGDALRLAGDLNEPFRPAVDFGTASRIFSVGSSSSRDRGAVLSELKRNQDLNR
ncbi:MAG: CRISPR-associated endonuclease Cas1 [Rhodomicrobium sp.]